MSLIYRPSGGYYRRALRAASACQDKATMLAIAFALVRETEYLRTWARANGLQPPHFEVTQEEADELGADTIAADVAVTRARVHASGPVLIESVAQGQR
jgi:hypothetical protein